MEEEAEASAELKVELTREDWLTAEELRAEAVTEATELRELAADEAEDVAAGPS